MLFNIAFIDLEIDPNQQKVMDVGVLCGEKKLHGQDFNDYLSIIAEADFMCGHYFLKHDFNYIKQELATIKKTEQHIIDTLLLSPLLFPKRPYHALDKDYKTEFEQSNNPLNDCLITRELLDSEIQAFSILNPTLQSIFYHLLGDKVGYFAFFKVMDFHENITSVRDLIDDYFSGKICQHAPLSSLIQQYPIALAYTLSLIDCDERHSISPTWLLHQHPEIEYIFQQLRATPCHQTCNYCDEILDIHKNLQRYFGYPSFREYDGKPLQAEAGQSAVNGESLLAVFPTGGGKSITFQVPALMAGEATKSLTVIISPLQSLMKDQVDNLEQRGITEAVTINGLLDPIERQKAFERIEDGSASLLYLSPESLRSRSIERLILGRHIARFVIDEAHCFSAWGQDFRVDYLYIGEFIQRIQTHKLVGYSIPVSCFTATAKPQVIEDIRKYFKNELDLDLKLFSASVARKNLHYKVLHQASEEQKYHTLRQLIQAHDCPTIVYVSRTAKTVELAKQLSSDGFIALAYHGKMDSEEKIYNQNSFITGETPIMVATSAFGMGVDKSDVGLVVHYQISDSLENYVQEAGRAGRNEQIEAQCYVLFADDDLDKHFILLNQTKISQKEIGQIWRALKELFAKHKYIAVSPLEIARRAGWNDENELDIETRVKTAICALEDVNYLKRGQNMPQVYANSILSKNAMEAIDKINQSHIIPADDKMTAIRIIKKLFSQKSQKYRTDETAESRIDYMADVLGLEASKIIKIVHYLRQEDILADQQDLQVNIAKNSRSYPIINKIQNIMHLEMGVLGYFVHHQGELHTTYKLLHQSLAEHLNIDKLSIKLLKSVMNFWKIKRWMIRSEQHHQELSYQLNLSVAEIKAFIQQKSELSTWIVNYFFQLLQEQELNKNHTLFETEHSDDMKLDFSLIALQQAYIYQKNKHINLNELEDALFYLVKMNLIKIEGGFLVIYQRLRLERLEMENRKQYTKDDYKKLFNYYETRREQIHIVGKYAELMLNHPKQALQLVNDYFSKDYKQFLKDYFASDESKILSQNMTKQRFQQWFGHLSPAQLDVIQDNLSQYIVVFATAGSGKTRVLVHKLASLYQMEDIKHEQLLMLTFSRAASNEFKSRLFELLGNASRFIEIKTFHSYCFDLLGRVGDLNQSDEIIQLAIDKIKQGEVEENRIAKLVLVIDEAQDMNQVQFDLIQLLMQKNEEMRVIAVGDDDQTIYTFMGASPHYMQQFCDLGATRYYLTENYRSKQNIVDFCNAFAKNIQHRLKDENIQAKNTEQGEVNYIHFSGDVTPYLIEQIKISQTIGGNIAILTQTNEEAIYLAGQLRQNELNCQLVQGNDGFKVYDLLEVRIFEFCLNLKPEQVMIDNMTWEGAKQRTKNNYCQRSSQFFLLENMWAMFESSHPHKKYISDWRIFIQEARLEDFYSEQQHQIFVSTIHKAKGREYDHVFVYLNQTKYQTDDEKRVLYVAFSRAKSYLHILSHDKKLYELSASEYVNYVEYQGDLNRENQQLSLYLMHRDVNLGKFMDIQPDIKMLQAGDKLNINNFSLYNHEGKNILYFSKKMREKLQEYLQKGYVMIDAEVNFVVLWKNRDNHQEYRIILPIIHLQKNK